MTRCVKDLLKLLSVFITAAIGIDNYPDEVSGVEIYDKGLNTLVILFLNYWFLFQINGRAEYSILLKLRERER
jgi:hypothetical protein